jgi:hypothetical protein
MHNEHDTGECQRNSRKNTHLYLTMKSVFLDEFNYREGVSLVVCVYDEVRISR